MHVRSALLALAVLFLPWADARIEACDCIRLQPLSAAVRKEAPFIFEGKVVEIVERSRQTLRTTSGGGSGESRPMGREVVFEVSRAWNGVTTKRLEVSAEVSDCMFPFEIDRTYVVFARDENGKPATSTCTRTMESSKAADVIAQLGPATSPATVTPGSFTTKARFSSGATSLSLSTAVATIEPRLGAPGYRWLRVRFYAFPLTPADVAAVTKGNVEPLEQRWKGKTSPEYNVSHAVLQFGVDKEGKVWQIDLSVPGHTCTIAASDQEAKALLQDYRFDGTRLRLKTKGAHSCERLAWDVDLTLPVFATGSPGR